MARTTRDAITWGRAWIGSTQKAPTTSGTWYRWCLVFVRSCLGVDALHPSAGAAWDNAQRKHRTSDPSEIPAGVPVFWETPGEADHIALSVGDGRCLSNDIRTPGRIDEVPIDEITRTWGATLLGWTEDLNGVTVYTPPPPDLTRGPVVDSRIKQLRRDRRTQTTRRRRTAFKAAIDALRALPTWPKRGRS